MYNLFYLNIYQSIIWVIFIFFLIIHQMLCIMYSFLHNNKCELFLNIWIEIYLFIHLMILSQVIFFTEQNYIFLNEWIGFRYILCIAITVWSCYLAWKNKTLFSLFNIILSSLTLPFFVDSFPVLFYISMLGWGFVILKTLNEYKKRMKDSISLYSIKEAVDTLDFGLLFYRQNGTIVLSNQVMHSLIWNLYNKRYYDAHDLLKQWSQDFPERTILLDDVSWKYEIQSFQNFNLIVIFDISEHKKENDKLYQKEKELKIRNQELNQMLNDLETICKTNELIRMKNRVHDILGQRISILLRTIREHQDPDIALLKEFSNDIIQELKNISDDCEYSLEMIVKDFESLGLQFETIGTLPKDKNIQKTFFEIALESTTNAIRHGYATCIHIESLETDTNYQLKIQNNGIIKENPIVEGGGITNMRRKMNDLHGSFTYDTDPQFTIIAIAPKERNLV